jgi:hypothetical protein
VTAPSVKQGGSRENGGDHEPCFADMYTSGGNLDDIENFRDWNGGVDADVFRSKCFIWGVTEFDVESRKPIGVR